MRPIKFRAKKDGMSDFQWVYGSLVYDSAGQPRITEIDKSGEGLLFHSCVDKTVGQFTGFTDKYEKDIYEGKESVKLVIKGCGEGLADIVMHEGKWCVFEKSQGYAPLYDLLNGNSTEIISLET